MNEDQIERLTSAAVMAALNVLDATVPDGRTPRGPMGDALAADLHKVIARALAAHHSTR